MLLLDGLINFSRSYLPETRGGTMDAPLVLTTRIDPAEVDMSATTSMSATITPGGLQRLPSHTPTQKT